MVVMVVVFEGIEVRTNYVVVGDVAADGRYLSLSYRMVVGL